ncbi:MULTISPECIES: hypothetical protein [unclassified Rhodococcus (in: high G+C Gram-positive bacteria)]|uniref:hypothetical protein n=1 Tax=unclassified Rhodococcus (in: high G+C Gram-positive bacteria) TaxID=192944 RepID=UPI0013202900|nr:MULTISPECIES: hypothetical protein [unclassified Rhodococcus (in: high G+C Gram-positive bacteria)]QHE74519.1 hypothetical protein GFS60_08223 [Rhodococcus sp. WAY2]
MTDQSDSLSTASVAPVRAELPDSDPRTKLRSNVLDALAALPFYFTSTINIEGLDAADLFSLNTLLGGAIEIQTVETLNRLRDVWDPDDEWQEYGFQRFSQSFPDVRLVKQSDVTLPVLGIELKGWYLLSKEAEPSFRYTANASACSPWDLIVVVPWTLSNVLSGTPRAHKPFVEQAGYAAHMRTYYWKHARGGNAASRNSEIIMATVDAPYPPAGTQISDRPVQDSGKNFGRVARVKGLMDEWKDEQLDMNVSGIPARQWIRFLAAFSETPDPEAVAVKVQAMLKKGIVNLTNEQAERIVALLEELGGLMS